MSKASEFVHGAKEGETLTHAVQRQRQAGKVTGNGSLALSDLVLSQREALVFAYWILDTFGETP